MHSTLLGEARANTYTYTSFLRDNTRIDLGSLMGRVIALSDDEELINAAQAVLAALDRGAHLQQWRASIVNQYASYYNIYFPDTSEDFKSEYFEQSPLKEWGRMLRNLLQRRDAAGLDGRRAGTGLSSAHRTQITNHEHLSLPA